MLKHEHLQKMIWIAVVFVHFDVILVQIYSPEDEIALRRLFHKTRFQIMFISPFHILKLQWQSSWPFLKKLKSTKRHFEINWPLADKFLYFIEIFNLGGKSNMYLLNKNKED